MTKINRITIHGFKSFAHKTNIVFGDDYNCILGPNGSGKSNVGDAICFVLGRLSAKSMRAEKAANLIYNGGKNGQPASSAYVEVAFCNKNQIFPVEEKELVIKRIIDKQGSSKYYLNNKKKTRTEILETLNSARINPEGYNIILQGDITRFVDMSPVDRRKTIEEISDVSVYEQKKHKALLELEKVEKQLGDAHIIINERKNHLKELKKDRDQALKYKHMKDNIDSQKATYLHLQIQEKEKEKAIFDEKVGKKEQLVQKNYELIEKYKLDIEEKQKEIVDINQKIEEKGEKGQLVLHHQIEDLKVELTKKNSRISTLKDEIIKLNQRINTLRNDIKEIEQKTVDHNQKVKDIKERIIRKNKEIEQIEKSIFAFKEKNNINSTNEIDQEIEQIDLLIEEKQKEVQDVRTEQQNLLREKDKLEYQLENLDEKIKKVAEVKKENKTKILELEQKKKEFKNSTLELNQCLDKDSSYAAQLNNAKNNLKQIYEEQDKLEAKSRSIKASLSNNQAVTNIIENKERFEGVYGTISELGQVNKRYALPLEYAAGPKMQNIVVENEKVAADCIKYLQTNKLGSASFIPLNRVKYREISSEDKQFLKKQGVEDFAINLVSYNSKYKKAFQYIFGNTLVVRDLEVARNIGVGNVKMVTMEGHISEASGVMRGGFLKKISAGGFKEKDTQEELEKISLEINQQLEIIKTIENGRLKNEERISNLRKLKSELEGDIIKLEKVLHLDKDDLDFSADLKKEFIEKLAEVDKNLENISLKISSLNKILAEKKGIKQTLREKVNNLRNPRLLAQLSAFEESRQSSREEIVRLESELKSNHDKMQDMIEPEKIKMQEIIDQHIKEIKMFNEEISQLTSDVKIEEKSLNEKVKESQDFYEKYKKMFNFREKLTTEINKITNSIESIREKNRENEIDINKNSLQNAEIKARLSALYEEFSKYKEFELVKNKTIEELKKEVDRAEIAISQMSAVNMKALEIYEKVEEEYNKLVEKKASLEQEKTEVLTLMNEIETRKKENFMVTFNQINENFQRIFSNLVKKGKAHLELEDPQNIFNEGMNIKVKLSGKRFMDIKSLSGGEKTLTALSFIFSIQEHQPASFYILDEIDAALDKSNSEHLAKQIGDYSKNAQYIIISHQDSIITEANTLYGVSMNENKISKITSLKI
jgi:chromosome segregation protein